MTANEDKWQEKKAVTDDDEALKNAMTLVRDWRPKSDVRYVVKQFSQNGKKLMKKLLLNVRNLILQLVI